MYFDEKYKKIEFPKIQKNKKLRKKIKKNFVKI